MTGGTWQRLGRGRPAAVVGVEMVHFLPLREYLFGTQHWREANPERGAYNRDFILVPIFDDEAVDNAGLDAYFRDLKQRAREGTARFDLLTSRLRNWWSSWNPFSMTLRALGVKQWRGRGNWARWTSEGLRAGGIRDYNALADAVIVVREGSMRAEVGLRGETPAPRSVAQGSTG